jgi:hypothetical protein
MDQIHRWMGGRQYNKDLLNALTKVKVIEEHRTSSVSLADNIRQIYPVIT